MIIIKGYIVCSTTSRGNLQSCLKVTSLNPSPGFKILNTEEEIYANKILIYGKSFALDKPRNNSHHDPSIINEKNDSSQIKSLIKSLSSSKIQDDVSYKCTYIAILNAARLVQEFYNFIMES
ncbi:hypothetical protein BpHYR1_031825 [Brachionus plicatilis]|uniref:Uncharacterized protein n=1 Tax=Brachionus plicatilis TaxID=10195 RepID=A0A3M7SYI5_BRAPC|nr:hypothetical protein BpHYR1_031825 [Brachionus plicatilis]